MRQPLKGATGCAGLFITWTDGWVGKTEKDFKSAPWHVWAAVLMCKLLIIYDSNSDLLPKGKVTSNDLWLHKQRALVTYLRNEGYHISDVWVGGEGNNDKGICLELTGCWIQKLMAGGLDINKLEEEGFRRVENVWRVP